MVSRCLTLVVLLRHFAQLRLCKGVKIVPTLKIVRGSLSLLEILICLLDSFARGTKQV